MEKCFDYYVPWSYIGCKVVGLLCAGVGAPDRSEKAECYEAYVILPPTARCLCPPPSSLFRACMLLVILVTLGRAMARNTSLASKLTML